MFLASCHILTYANTQRQKLERACIGVIYGGTRPTFWASDKK